MVSKIKLLPIYAFVSGMSLASAAYEGFENGLTSHTVLLSILCLAQGTLAIAALKSLLAEKDTEAS